MWVEQATLDVQVEMLDGATLPYYATEEAAGADLRARLPAPTVLQPGERSLIRTGLRVALPPGFELQIRSRSGWALREGLTVLNAPGTIDSDYRGELCVLLINHGQDPVQIDPGARIAQAVIAPVVRATWVPVAQLDTQTERGEGGFGHTGRH